MVRSVLGVDKVGRRMAQTVAGTVVGAARVVGRSTGLLNGRVVVSVRLSDGTVLRSYPGSRVAGTRPRTDLPAGPVGAGRGMRSTSRGRRDGESAGDRHSRLMDGLVYA